MYCSSGPNTGGNPGGGRILKKQKKIIPHSVFLADKIVGDNQRETQQINLKLQKERNKKAIFIAGEEKRDKKKTNNKKEKQSF